jgi:hypothetical protein
MSVGLFDIVDVNYYNFNNALLQIEIKNPQPVGIY